MRSLDRMEVDHKPKENIIGENNKNVSGGGDLKWSYSAKHLFIDVH